MDEGFRDRVDAGRRLAERLGKWRGGDVVVLGLPRGGVPVAAEVAQALGAPLDVIVARKLGAPGNPELGMGAIAEGGAVYVNERIRDAVGATPGDVEAVIAAERAELERRVQRYRGGRSLPELRDRTVILVDDGIATGGTVLAAIRALRLLDATYVVVAVPVAAAQTCEALRGMADEVIALKSPADLVAIGWWYADFRQTSDEEVVDLLARCRG
jgi:putative phosphoribosyl transferase